MTTGFLGLASGRANEILEILDHLDCYVAQPTLLLIVMYSVYATRVQRTLHRVQDSIEVVQRQTGLLDNFLKSNELRILSNDNMKDFERPNYDDLHQKLVEEHARLTNSIFYFVADLGIACFETMKRVEEIRVGISDVSNKNSAKELHSYLSQIKNVVDGGLQYRESSLSRIEMQLKVVRSILYMSISKPEHH